MFPVLRDVICQAEVQFLCRAECMVRHLLNRQTRFITSAETSCLLEVQEVISPDCSFLSIPYDFLKKDSSLNMTNRSEIGRFKTMPERDSA